MGLSEKLNLVLTLFWYSSRILPYARMISVVVGPLAERQNINPLNKVNITLLFDG